MKRRATDKVKHRTYDPLVPDISVLIKLGSIAVHAEELTSPKGHPFDSIALKQLLEDPEVKKWISEMSSQALLPHKR